MSFMAQRNLARHNASVNGYQLYAEGPAAAAWTYWQGAHVRSG
jgi:hypothetical protein